MHSAADFSIIYGDRHVAVKMSETNEWFKPKMCRKNKNWEGPDFFASQEKRKADQLAFLFEHLRLSKQANLSFEPLTRTQ